MPDSSHSITIRTMFGSGLLTEFKTTFGNPERINGFIARTAAMFGQIDRPTNLITSARVEFRKLRSCDQAESPELNDRSGFQEFQPGR